MSVRSALLATLLAAMAPLVGHAAETLVGVASVVDGDTIEVHGKRIRLHGIDAPESRQECTRSNDKKWRCGQLAALALADKMGRGTVRCEGRDQDRYGRIVAVCFKGAENLNRWLVANGWAVAYRRYSNDYVAAEEAATADRRGIWSGDFEMPWDWRRGASAAANPPRSGGCNIKGNISRGGERIYHLPGTRSYEQTQIDEAKGERWFCNEDEAQSAGWRRVRSR